jgi:TDG/mug DNA glycosylase family protein
MPSLPKPTNADLLTSAGRTLPALITPNLQFLFCGINPSLYSAYTGHHFARPGNRFWPTLYAAGFTDRRLAPSEEQELLHFGCGITSMVARATASAAELTTTEYIAGGQRLLATVEQFRPRVVAILGIGAFRTAFGRPRAGLGRQSSGLGSALLWVLPNPSGLNAHYTPTDLARIFRDFRLAAIGGS